MALLPILQYPDPRLRTKAALITHIDDELRRIVDDMYETMYDSKGVGLAATQVNIHQRLFVMDVSPDKTGQITVLNPEILSMEGEIYEDEGCLSVVGAYDKVKRAQKLRMRGMDLAGNTFELEAEDLMSVCVQHEIDHLNGILFVDHLSRLKQERIKKKMSKSQHRK